MGLRRALMPMSGSCCLAYLCAGLYVSSNVGDRQFSLVIQIADALPTLCAL
jgi:hypothetical protein